MPVFGAQDLPNDLDATEQAAATAPVSQALRYNTEADWGGGVVKGLHFLQQPLIDAGKAVGFDPSGLLGRGTLISPEDANRDYGVDGYLRFNAPVDAEDAAYRGYMAKQRQFRDAVLAHSTPTPLRDIGYSLAGSLLDPVNVGLAFATDGLGEMAMTGLGLREAASAGEGGLAISRLGRVLNPGAVARTVGVGAVDNLPFVAVNGVLDQDAGEDYSGGDALRDLAAGAILHTTLHTALRAFSEGLGHAQAMGGEPSTGASPNAFSPDPVPASGVPGEVDALPETARQGAFALALDQMADDEPVDVGGLVARELEPPGLDRLNEATAEPQVQSWRPLDADTAVTTRGTEVPVRYGLAELSDLVTSHDDDLGVNPAYPAELQPRARERAGAMARNYQLEKELNPKLLMGDVGAGSGAPIVGPDGTVESGNGRTIALRRSAAAGGEAYARYRAALQAAGHDTSGMKAPALVRMREQAMTGAQRSALAREMNADVTERMGAAEQARVDASRISDASFEQLPDNSTPWGSREFARDFIARAAPDQANVLANGDGSLSPEGARRIKAAVLARAYDDPRLVAQVHEDEGSDPRKLADALAEAAPLWARMRAAAALNAIPKALDLTQNLVQALDLMRWAKSEGRALPEVVKELEGQGDMFKGSALSPDTLKMLRLITGDGFSKIDPKLAGKLKAYAAQALKVTPGKDLFGKAADVDTARDILAHVAEKFRTNDAGPVDIVRPPGPSRAEGVASGPVIDLNRPEPAKGEVGIPTTEAEGGKPQKVSGDQLIAADPELRELLKETERLEAENGQTPEIPETQDPNTVAEAIRAAAVCLAEES